VKDQLESLVNQMIDHGILFTEAVSEFEKRFIKRMLEKNNGNHSKTAKALGIHRNTLSRKVGDLELDRRPKRRRRTSR
jgi:transcriptional regulator with PAS, ATPase and Fis domain